MNSYFVGSLIRCSAAFTDTLGADLDPTTVSFSFKIDNGSVTTYVYGTDAQVVKDSTGHYHVDLSGATKGTLYYRWFSTGTGQAADEGAFYVIGVVA